MRIILVEPEYDINVGSVCRLMKNLGFSELFLVNPKCSLGLEAIKFSKHARDLLDNATICKSFDEAILDCEQVIGTSGIIKRNKDTIRGSINLSNFQKKASSLKNCAIVFGREGSGLNSDEISKCDFLVRIETSKTYPVMNLSHAAAIILYSITKIKEEKNDLMEKNQLLSIIKYVKSLSKKTKIRNSEIVALAIKRILRRSFMSKFEADLLLMFFREIDK